MIFSYTTRVAVLLHACVFLLFDPPTFSRKRLRAAGTRGYYNQYRASPPLVNLDNLLLHIFRPWRRNLLRRFWILLSNTVLYLTKVTHTLWHTRVNNEKRVSIDLLQHMSSVPGPSPSLVVLLTPSNTPTSSENATKC